MPPEPPRRAWWMAKRVLVAAVGIVLLTGGATYAVARNEVGKVVEALDQNKAVKVAPKVLAPTSKGAPETLLLVGNDERKLTQYNHNEVLPHSNEMLLVRIDPSKPTISMLSIPRELQVTFTAPNGEVITNRINSAYTYGFEDGGGTSGGVKLMLETIKNVLGITVNHVFVTNFKKFEHAVNQMGCVYMTVDKRYYHSNSEPGAEQYFEINLQPGYQRLCGKQALEFVANRHESTSLIRDARDQRFLLEVKAEYGSTLFGKREKFERILGKAMETDLHGEEEVLQLLELLVESAGKPVRQVPFHVNLLPTVDTATPEQLQEAAQSFMDGTAPISTRNVSKAVNAARPRRHAHGAPAPLPLTPTSGEALDQARAAAPQLPFPLEYPRVRDANGEAEPDMLRVYSIHDRQGHLRPIYVIVIDRGGLGEYYDVQGSSWTDSPLLSNPSQTVQIGSRTYSLYYAAEQIRTIAWHEDGAAYWIQNTLTNSISPHEMLAMAEQTLPVVTPRPNSAQATPAIPSMRDVNLPPREIATTSLTSKLEAALGFVGLAAVLLLALIVLSRRRELVLLREQIAQAMTLEARQRPLLATTAGAGTTIPAPEPALTIYRARKRWRRGILAAAAVVIAVGLVALAGYLLQAGPFATSTPSRTPSRPPIPVAVFNATSTAGAAHGIADQLKAARVKLGDVGNINAGLSAGVYVFYPPGAQTQARRIAHLISRLSPTVAPIQPQVQNAVGNRNEIVVIFD
jgi:polyisoprenyl-teichoic acid--peptidoglycan teichoic acid transferase